MRAKKGVSGKGSPGPDLPGTGTNREETQGDWAAEGREEGASLSVGDDHLTGPEQLDRTFGGPLLDISYLESLFEDVEYPAAKDDVLAGLERRGEDHPVSGVDVPGLVESLEKERYMNQAELVEAVKAELARRAHSP